MESAIEPRPKAEELNPYGAEGGSVPGGVWWEGSEGFWERTTQDVPDEEAFGSELHRERFRRLHYREVDGPRKMWTRLHNLCCQWLKPERRSKVEMLDLVILEQFLAVLPPETERWVRKCGVESGPQAVALAEGFLLSREEEEEKTTAQDVQRERDVLQAQDVPPGARRSIKRSTPLVPGDEPRMPESRSRLSLLLQGGIEMASGQPDQVTFEDVFVCFAEEEWGLLGPEQRALHREVMEENYQAVAALGDNRWETENEESPCRVQFERARCSQDEEGSSGTEAKEEQKGNPLPASHGADTCEIPIRDGTDKSEETSKCLMSGNGFHWTSGLNIRITSDTGERHSPQWGESAKWSVCLADPEGSPTGEKVYACQETGRILTAKAILTEYEMNQKGEKPYKCLECGMSFSYKSSFKTHKVVHTLEKPYQCLECGKSFHSRPHLSRHELIHTGEKPHTCLECGKCFNQRRYLKAHQLNHVGEKPYQCLECGKSFSYKSFKTHQVVHTLEKPHQCPECGKSFHWRSHLDRHQRIHTGEKPYQCPECGKGFIDKRGLTTHRMNHTGERPHTCLECGKGFTHKSVLKTHQATHTPRAVLEMPGD